MHLVVSGSIARLRPFLYIYIVAATYTENFQQLYLHLSCILGACFEPVLHEIWQPPLCKEE